MTPFADANIAELRELLDKVNKNPAVQSLANNLSTAINNLEGNQSAIIVLRDAYHEVADQNQIPDTFKNYISNAKNTLSVRCSSKITLCSFKVTIISIDGCNYLHSRTCMIKPNCKWSWKRRQYQ